MIIYRESTDGVTADQLTGFFVSWPIPPTPETHLQVLAPSDAIVLAVNEETARVVGYITATTDHVLTAYIPRIEVLPEFREVSLGGRS
ncbi:MAG: GNAT family N-acetyltransferase [Chloroflexota bacterium]|nr:GNAT family N-acetyltransferase [Chloroflexota bacterium]